MSVNKPYYLTVRQFKDGSYANSGRSLYISHPSYGEKPSNYIRAFELIEKDLLTLFEYIEPAAVNRKAYSFRTFELFLRTCTEIEANFKSILRSNTYSRSSARNLNIEDYFKINSSHFLSKYEVHLPHWDGTGSVRRPFKLWNSVTHRLDWYQSYNDAKHDRAQNLGSASLENLVDAVCGLAVVIAAQFYTYTFTGPDYIIASGPDGDEILGNYFRIIFPKNIPNAKRYDFDWQTLQNTPNPLQKFDYDKV